MKGITSFTVEPRIYEKFQKLVPLKERSATIEQLIIEFLDKKTKGDCHHRKRRISN